MKHRATTRIPCRRHLRLVGLVITATLLATACSNQGEAIGVANAAATPESSDASATAPSSEAPVTEAPTSEAPVTAVPITAAPTTAVPTTALESPVAESERPSQQELAAVLAVGIAGTPAADQLSVDQLNCVAGVLVDSQLPDHVLVAVINNSSTLTDAEHQQLRQQSEAAAIVCG